MALRAQARAVAKSFRRLGTLRATSASSSGNRVPSGTLSSRVAAQET